MRPRCNERKWHRGGAGVGDNQVICISPPAAATSLYILHWPDAAQAEAVQWPEIFGSLLYGGAGIVEQARRVSGAWTDECGARIASCPIFTLST